MESSGLIQGKAWGHYKEGMGEYRRQCQFKPVKEKEVSQNKGRHWASTREDNGPLQG
jgi:hypothetical protein